MIPFFSRLRSEVTSRFNPEYFRYRVTREKSEMDGYLSANAENIHTHGLDQIRFSIVLPTYGIELSLVKELIESIRRQTFSEWEVCAHDDGDSDKSVANYLAELAERDPKHFRFSRSESNQGICHATLKAIELVRADYVVLVDADDRLHPRALELFARTIAVKTETDFLYSNHDYMTSWGFRLHPMIKPGWSPELLLHVNYINHLKVIRRDLLSKISAAAFDASRNGAQDWSLCFQVLLHARSVSHVPFMLYHWRTRRGSMASDVFSKPWAVEAQARLRSEFLPELATDLRFNLSENRVVPASTAPSVFQIDASIDSEIREWFKKTLLAIENTSASIVRFGVDFHGQSSLSAYAQLPRVGCVWPFKRSRQRTAYTIGSIRAGFTELIPLEIERGSYSYFTGNVLAGPLEGLTIARERAVQIFRTVLKNDFTESLETPEGRQEDVAGALLSFAALQNGFRNASVDVIGPEMHFGPVKVPARFATVIDPYI